MEKINILSLPAGWTVKQEKKTIENVDYFDFYFKSETPRSLEGTMFQYKIKGKDINMIWYPKVNLIRAMTQNWFNNRFNSSTLTGAAVNTLIGLDDKNILTLALSESDKMMSVQTHVIEETAEYETLIEFQQKGVELTSYHCQLRVDPRPLVYTTVLKDVGKWWEEKYEAFPTPLSAKKAVYSTWYAFHQEVYEEEVLKECRLSKELGCKTLIIDDGWQTDDNSRGYGLCGDWNYSHEKISNMALFIDKIHDMDMKVLLWYTVPFIGVHSMKYQEFKNRILNFVTDEWAVLDPRYPDVREFIIETYENALRNWDIDGFKLDFLDEFVVTPLISDSIHEEMDFQSVEESVLYLLQKMIFRLSNIKEDLMFEYRQTFNTPAMKQYGNIFRAVDCPLYADENRVRIVDIRMLSGSVATHSDMFMWHPETTAEDAALQLINSLFSVPQLSVKISELSEEHYAVVAFYLSLWNNYRELFLEGEFYAAFPQHRYPILYSRLFSTMAITLHSDMIVQCHEELNEIVLVNGTKNKQLWVKGLSKKQVYRIQKYNCMGNKLPLERIQGMQINAIEVPISGVVIIQKEGLHNDEKII